MAFRLPVGPDWADGVNDLPDQPLGVGDGHGPVGTPNAIDSRQVDGPGGTTEISIEQIPDSPELERAEQGTFQQRLSMLYDTAIGYLGVMGRGTFVQDSGRLFGVPTVWRILSAKVKRIRKGNEAELSYTAESISFDSPPDEYSVSASPLGLDILKHPRYAWALNPVDSDTGTYVTVGDTTISFVDIKTAIIRMIQSYRDAPFFPSANQVNGLIQSNIMDQLQKDSDNKTHIDVQIPILGFDPNPADGVISDIPRWNGVGADLPDGNYPYAIVSAPVDLSSDIDPIVIAIAAARELISKLWRQEDAPYLPIVQITRSQYFFAPVYLDLGGYTQNPLDVIPDYFIDPNQDGTDNIFSQLSKINPQLFSTTGINGGPINMTGLRQADSVEYQRTWFKVTQSWLVSFIGTFDPQLYTTKNRPQKASDYVSLI